MKNECYPSWRYHATQAPKLVHSKAESDALGKEWADTPAAFAEPKQSEPPSSDEDELADVPPPPEPDAPPADATADAPKAEKPFGEHTAKELRALVEARGLKLPGNASKAAMIEALLQGGEKA